MIRIVINNNKKMTKEIKKIMDSIDPNQYYALYDIFLQGLFGKDQFGKNNSYYRCKNIMAKDNFGDKILNTEMRGSSVGTRYFILGKNIIEYLIKNN